MLPIPAHVQPLSALPPALAARVAGVFTDIDDTLTRDGAIEPQALDALRRLQRARLPVIAITGRPMGWSQPFAAAWPLAAIVAENGAVALLRQGEGVVTEYAQDEPTRAANAVRLRQVAERILREVPGARLATDSPGRVTDIAIDHAEHARLDEASIERVVALMREEGMNATVSSIHVNGWFGAHTKLSAADWMLRRLFGRALDEAEAARWVYVGDSTNDQLMFAHFPLSVGVANLRDFAGRLHTWPRYLAAGERGRGFAEVADRLLQARATGEVQASA